MDSAIVIRSILNPLIIITTSALFSILLIPIVNKFGLRFNILDIPEKRKQHKSPLVRLGGIAVLLSFLFTTLSIRFVSQLKIETINNSLEWIFFFAIILYFMLGILDDILYLSPIKRLFVQFSISSIVFFIGINLSRVNFDLFDKSFSIQIPLLINFLITLIWLTGITNAINWLDGLDGLAAGISIIISITIGLISFDNNHILIYLFSIALAGANLGFLIFNYYPSKILMGDCGSYFTGFCLASLSIMSTKISSENIIVNTYNTEFLIALTILSLPILDMFIVILKRLKNKKSPFYPDRNHFHHVLLRLGFNHKNTVNIMYSICQLTCCFGLYLHDAKYKYIFLGSSFFSIIFIYLNILKLNNTKLT